MALTRAMAAKLASQSSVVDRDITSSQPKTSPRHRYPSSSSTSSSSSSASSSSSFSPPLTPTTLVNDSPPSISLVSHFNNFVDNVSQKFHDISQKIEHISNRMPNIEESIGDQRFIINELERELAIVADRLNKISLKRSDNTSSSSVKITLHKGTQTNDNNISLTSSPRIDSLSTSNPQSLPQSSLAFHSIDLHRKAPKSTFSARPATYWRSTSSSCPTPPGTPTPTRAEGSRSVAPNPRPRNRAPLLQPVQPVPATPLPTLNICVLILEHHLPIVILSPNDQPAQAHIETNHLYLFSVIVTPSMLSFRGLIILYENLHF